MTDIERITDMEQCFDRVDRALRALEEAVDTITSLEDDLGLLPQDLKRGVLSEDAIWDLLGRVDGVKHRMLDFVLTDLG